MENLAKALSAFQAEVEDAHKDKEGYGYRYADLAQCLKIARPLMAKHGLSLAQFPCAGQSPETMGLRSILLHESGEMLESTCEILVEKTGGMSLAQAAGSVVTYLRRYALTSILGIAQDDNDAAPAKDKPAPKDKPADPDLITSKSMDYTVWDKDELGAVVKDAKERKTLIGEAAKAIGLTGAKMKAGITKERFNELKFEVKALLNVPT